MPEICRFYGIVIRMRFVDHPPPHFHVQYGDHQAVIEIGNSSLLAGDLPPRALGLVTEWAALHREELVQCWERARRLEPPGRIAPLE